MREVVITSAVRTPVGSFQGVLSPLTAPQLGSLTIRAVLERGHVAGAEVDEVIMGNVLTAGVGQAPARQAARGAGLPDSVGALTVNKVCGSSLKAVMLAANTIRCGEAEVIVAGGQESMSNAPYLLPKARTGYRMGHGELVDSMVHDGLWDVYNDFHMGAAAELCAEEYGFGREAQDAYATESYRRAMQAQADGAFTAEIVPVSVPQRKGDPVVVDVDEEPGRGKPEKIPSLRPAFKPDGTVTAANASSINDGASAVVVMSREKADALGLRPLARIIGQTTAGVAPEWFTIAPAEAVRKLHEQTGHGPANVDLYEINEAFAVVPLTCNQLCGLSAAQVNVHGGAVAIGHPIGASGARIFTTLLHAMEQRDAARGVASLCIGGGEAVAVMVERV